MKSSFFFLFCLPHFIVAAQQLALQMSDGTVIAMDVAQSMRTDNTYGAAWVLHNPGNETHFNTSLPLRNLSTHQLFDCTKFFLDFYGNESAFIEFIGGQYSVLIQQVPEPEDGQEFVVDSSQHKCFLIVNHSSNHQKKRYELKEMRYLDGQEITQSCRDPRLSVENQKDVYVLKTADQKYSDDYWQVTYTKEGFFEAIKKEGDRDERYY